MQEENAQNVSILPRIERLRVAEALTWEQLATTLGISRSLLNQIKSGRRRVSPRMERKLREAESRAGLEAPEAARIFLGNLRAILSASGWTQAEAAKYLDISEQVLRDSQHLGALPNAEALAGMAKRLNVAAEQLVTKLRRPDEWMGLLKKIRGVRFGQTAIESAEFKGRADVVEKFATGFAQVIREAPDQAKFEALAVMMFQILQQRYKKCDEDARAEIRVALRQLWPDHAGKMVAWLKGG